MTAPKISMMLSLSHYIKKVKSFQQQPPNAADIFLIYVPDTQKTE
jgi:hypothetical protein